MPKSNEDTNIAFPQVVGASCLNRGEEKSEAPFHLYARAFHKAGEDLAHKPKLDRGGLSSFDACPIVFLYRQAIELYLKALLQELGELSDESLTTHDLRKLLPPIRWQFERWEIEKKLGTGDVATFHDLERLVDDLCVVDPGSFAFRYPIDKHRKSALPLGFGFSVMDFAKRFDPVLSLLSGCVSYVSERLQMEAETAAEAHSDMVDW